MARKNEPAPPGKKWIYRSWITTKNGKKIHASWYGIKAFRLLVDIDE